MLRDLRLPARGARAVGLLVMLLSVVSLACNTPGEAPTATSGPAVTAPAAETPMENATPAPPRPTRVPTQAPAGKFVPVAPNALGGIGGQGEGVAPDNGFLILFPELRDAPAPEWLRPGLRVTFRVESATIAQAAGEQGATGAGYLQYDLVALDRQAAVSTVRLDIDEIDGNGVIPFMTLPSAGFPGAGDYWIAPEVLQDAERVATGELKVLRGPADVEGETYQVVRFEYRTEGALYAWMFEEQTGLMVFYGQEIGKETDARKQIAQMRLAGQRALSLPWRGGTLPAWAAEGTALRYTGSYVVGSPAAGVPDTAFPSAVSVDIARCGEAWCEVRLASTVQGRPEVRSARMVGAAQIFDAFWLPPEALRALADGKVLDRDPVTGAEIRVARTGNGRIVLTESARAYAIELVYDEGDGALVAVRQETRNGLIVTVIDLQLQRIPNGLTDR